MNNSDDVLSTLLPLCTAERLCKHFLMEHPDARIMDSEQLQSLFHDVLDIAIEPVNTILTENSMIPEGYNVMVLKHLRYLPGCFHSHEFFEINCVLSGTCGYQTVGKSVTLHSGDIVLFPPKISHLIEVHSDDCILINILVRSNTFDPYFFSFFERNDFMIDFWQNSLYGNSESAYLLFHCENNEKVRDCVLDMYQDASGDYKYKSQMLDALLHVLMITLLRYYDHDIIIANPRRGKDDGNIVRIISFVETNCTTLTLEELADKFHYSRRQMIRILKEYTGLGFKDLIQDIKVKKAVTLLKADNISVSSIAETVGFYDLSHFYRVFKKKIGCTPVEYRTEYQKKATGE